MGVSGAGKTLIGRLLANRLGLPFHDGDDFQPETNRRKMAAGIALTDEDRQPWLEELARRIPGWEAEGGAVLACSALRVRYRELLRRAAGEPVFVFLDAPVETLRRRLDERSGHYMPASLLDSQLDTLERPSSEEALHVRADRPPEQLVDEIANAL